MRISDWSSDVCSSDRLLLDGDKSAPGGEQAAPASPDAEAAPPSTIEMSADRIKTAEIGLFTVGDAGFGSEIIAQGSVEAPPRGLAVLTAGADGRITRIYKHIGDPVARGERVQKTASRDAAPRSGDLRTASDPAATPQTHKQH